MSHEHIGMRVSLTQKFGTLIGLRNGLMLESLPKLKKKTLLLMPHGVVKVTESSVHIENKSLRQPPFFIYEVDAEYKQLRAQKNFSAWFYLAHLHAFTSQTLPDPFSGLTGTERALQILQSGLVWSSEPYDNESISTLQNLSRLSPVRSFYPKHLNSMQQINWPSFIPSIAAHDGYKMIKEKLIKDSERLKALHFESDYTTHTTEGNQFLAKRAYLRHLQFNPNAKISEKFLDYQQNSYALRKYNRMDSAKKLKEMQIFAILSDEKLFHVPKCSCQLLKDFMVTSQVLEGVKDRDFGKIFDYITPNHSNLRNLWIDLYNTIRRNSLTKEKFTLLLELAIFEGWELNQIWILHAVFCNQQSFATINPPPYSSYEEPKRNSYESETIIKLITSVAIGQDAYIKKYQYRIDNEDDDDDKEIVCKKIKREYENEVLEDVAKFSDEVRRAWPSNQCHVLNGRYSDVLDFSKAHEPVNALFQMWYRNRQLLHFLTAVGNQLQNLSATSTPLPAAPCWNKLHNDAENVTKFIIYFESKLCQNLVQHNDLITKLKLIHNGSTSQINYTDNDIIIQLNQLWKKFASISAPESEQHLINAGMYPRLVPSLVFPRILTTTNEDQRTFIGALAVLTTFHQRESRVEILKTQPHMEVIYRRELETIPHANWKPCDYPEWLLLQIDMNLTIRRIQVEVAKEMIQPSSGENSVMQLNMGEGKTAVIVPILAAILSNQKQVCQITVLKSLFKTNLKSLRQCLGGLLNRRVYTFPCRRDMKVDENASEIYHIYRECMNEKGTIITLPEYRLSFQLKMYESVLKGNLTKSAIFLETHKWLNQNIRNILDESDAILHAKYQLIYTCGEQLLPDGGALRWTIAQALLKLIPEKLEALWRKHGDEKIEFPSQYVNNQIKYNATKERPEVFWPCRIIDDSIYQNLIDSIADDFINGKTIIRFPELRKADAVLIKKLITQLDLSLDEFSNCLNTFEEQQKQSIFILCGLLKYGILRLVLSKRWRVNYGVNPKGPRQMAVPFKAKDVAAEMTEFGHSDVAICFTHLSYYYSGLSDDQLFQALNVLNCQTNAVEVYNDWVDHVPELLKNDSVRNYSGINLSDPIQREKQLFPILRFNMYVIDFWLALCVFPREAKLFPRKMMCTAWDLCSENLKNFVTGFSGTNDTKLLLPLPIHQNDLKELKETNENMRQVLLLDENTYQHLEPNFSGLHILKMLVNNEIPVLLDSGALMLELNNIEAATQWLKLVSDTQYDGAVYFNKDDVLMAIDRNGNESEFEMSVFRERLDRCVVYLDDTHTRGTDLKFPKGTRACVTLSGGITHDKTVQACMRMRMLGQGHTVSFWASDEADNKIRQLCNKQKHDTISTSDVVDFIRNNSNNFEKEGLVHWCAAGLNYTQKLSAHRAFENSANSLNMITERSVDNEILKLSQLFGVKESTLLTKLMKQKFSKLKEMYPLHADVGSWVKSNGDQIVKILEKYIPETERYTQLLDEEQEKELEHELEEQREVHRPGKSTPMVPAINDTLKLLFKYGLNNNTIKTFKSLKNNNEILHLPYGLEKTTMWTIAQKDSWGRKIYVTKDFNSVIIKNQAKDKEDEFLRPVWWIVSINSSVDYHCGSPILLVLSPHECNHFISIFRSSDVNSTLHMYSPRTQMYQSLLINNKKLQMPLLKEVKCIDYGYLSELTLFAGSIYFDSKEEQDAYSSFLGMIPRPRSTEHQKAFDDQLITSNGFVSPENRHISSELSNWCKFNGNPDQLVVKIAETRVGFLPCESHVSLLVNESKKRFN